MANSEGRILVSADQHTFIRGEIVTILVGDEQKPFAVHKDLLVSRSSWLAAELAKPTTCVLPHVVEDYFDLYVQCVYTGTLPCRISVDEDYETQDLSLVEVYVLAAQLGDEKTMHMAMNAIIEAFRNRSKRHNDKCAGPTSDSIRTAYESYWDHATVKQLCKLLVDLVIWAGEWDKIEVVEDGDFSRDLAEAAVTAVHHGMKGGKQGWKTITCCDYHTRADGKVCGSKKRKRESE